MSRGLGDVYKRQLIILCLIVSPLGGTIWFVQTVKQISVSMKQKKKTKSTESDVFDI